MAMTPLETIEFFKEQVELFTTPLEDADTASDYGINATRSEVALSSQMMAALMLWRLGQSDPSPELQKVVSLTTTSADTLEQLSPGSPHWRAFNLCVGVFASTILEGVSEPGLVMHLPNESAFLKPSNDSIDVLLDAALCLSIQRQEVPETNQALLRFAGSKTRLHLVHDTYQEYFRLVRAAASGADWKLHIARLEEYFLARRSNRYFSGGVETAGGGPNNDLVVDYRLAAIIRSFSIPATASVHAWKLPE